MRLKSQTTTPYGGWCFFFEAPDGETVRVPEWSRNGQVARNANALRAMVVSSMRNNGMDIPDDLDMAIQHQLCIRNPNPLKACYSGGVGDDLHQRVAKPLLTKVANIANRLGARRVAKAIRKASKCSGCGGTKVYQQNVNNLGRAGTVNKLNSGRFMLNADYKTSNKS